MLDVAVFEQKPVQLVASDTSAPPGDVDCRGRQLYDPLLRFVRETPVRYTPEEIIRWWYGPPAL